MPADHVTHPSQTYTSPDGTAGYLAIHRCASSSIGQWLKYDGGFGWSRGIGFGPGITEVLCVVRDPIDRWFSALAQLETWTGNVDERVTGAAATYTNRGDGHFAPQVAFIAPYLTLPLVYVNIGDMAAWFTSKSWAPPPNINESDPVTKARLVAAFDNPGQRKRLRDHYAADVALLGQTWQP